MKNLRLLAAALGIAFGFALVTLWAQKGAAWKHFSNADLDISYPPTWEFAGTGDNFVITNFPAAESLKPLRLRKGAAQISARRLAGDPQNLDQAVNADPGAGRLLQKTELHGPALAQSPCRRLFKIVRKVPLSARSYDVSTSFYCIMPQATYELALRNAQGDPRHRYLQQTARQVLATLKAR